MQTIDHEVDGRRALHGVALAIIGSRGLDGLNVAALAQQSRMPVGFVERCYPTAVGCLTATYDQVAADVLAELGEALRGQRSRGAILRTALSRLITRMDASPAEARLCFGEILRAGRIGVRRHAAVVSRIVGLLDAALRDGRPDGSIDAIQLELLVGAVFQGCVEHTRSSPGRALRQIEPELIARARALDPFRA